MVLVCAQTRYLLPSGSGEWTVPGRRAERPETWQEAQALFESNGLFLETQADLYDSENLRQDSYSNYRASRNLSDEDWIRERKQSTFEADWSMY